MDPKTMKHWLLVIGENSLGDEAMKVASKDLADAGKRLGIRFEMATGAPEGVNCLLVGDALRNKEVANLVEQGVLALNDVGDPQGYEIVSADHGGRRMVVVAGGSISGDVYGLYRIRDRLRVEGEVPDLTTREAPDLQLRYSRVRVESEEDIRRALRYRLNLVFGENPLKLVPWGEGELANAEARDSTRTLAKYAHALHMKFVTFGTDFTYHPSILEEFGAKLDPTDPGLWEAVKAKYRRLLEALPEIDGVCTFLGEEQAYWDPYQMFDLVHAGGEDWSLERRYRAFVKAVWGVVAGEFGKMLIHRTWNTTSYEQHSQPDIYVRTFTDDLPTERLYLVPSFTQNDRWWFQAHNPTFNLTPHEMLAVFETMNYHAARGEFFPTFPGYYFQAGLDSVLGAGGGNLRGASFDLPRIEGWDTRSLTAYTVARLTWNYKEDPRTIARDFCSIHFGPELAAEMADILTLSPVAYKYGLYIEPVVYGAFTSLHHIRTGRFIAEGYPSIDGGREHIEFLRKIYLRCKPWIGETITYLDHGLEVAREMEAKFAVLKPRIATAELAEGVEGSLRLMRLLIQTNNLYVKTFFAYFRYREEPTEERRKALETYTRELNATKSSFVSEPGCAFQLFGVNELLRNAKLALEDLGRAEEMLASAPDTQRIEAIVLEQQRRYSEILESHREEAVKVLYWEGRVDGRDILVITGDQLRIEHLRWDGIYIKAHEFHAPLPKRPGCVFIEDIESEPMHPFVLRQPRADNGYTARVYMNDVPGGAHWFRFNVYFIERTPEEMGLDVPWDR